jgi:Putative addiction module component
VSQALVRRAPSTCITSPCFGEHLSQSPRDGESPTRQAALATRARSWYRCPVKTDELLSAVLALPSTERAKIAHTLLRSLDDTLDDEDAVALDWASELAKRSLEVANGSVDLVDWDTVEASALARCRVP